MEKYENNHIPVLLSEVSKFIDLRENLNIFDGTLGGGGYTKKFLSSGHRVYSSDLDKQALENFHKEISKTDLSANFQSQQSNFAQYIDTFEDNYFDFIVLDLGFSSNQLSHSGRGFSYQNIDEILDLRYDTNISKPCWELLKSVKTVDNLGKIIYKYSGESLCFRIARSMLVKIEENELETVANLVDSVKKAIPLSLSRKQNAILSRVWQSLRIWVNAEFESLEVFLPRAVKKLKPGGRLAIVSFHSLEDKIVTKYMRYLAKPIDVDDFGNTVKNYNLLTAKPIVPVEKEILENPRSRSAILRVLEKNKKN